MTNASACCIVLVNWNNWRDTVACIESCKELRGAAFHIVVVDNGSDDESPLEIARRHPDVQILRLPTNEGFAAGCNAGIKFAVAAGDAYVWLLNNDTRVDPDALDALVQDMASHPCAGIVGSKILNWEEPDKLSFAGGRITRWSGRSIHIGEGELDRGQYDTARDVEYCTGASMLVRLATIEEVGLLDETFFMYWEDADLCRRVHDAGWSVRYSPASRVWHKVGATTRGGLRTLQPRYEARNRILFHMKHNGTRWITVAALAIGNATYLMLRLRPVAALSMAMGVLDALLRRRGPVSRRHTASPMR